METKVFQFAGFTYFGSNMNLFKQPKRDKYHVLATTHFSWRDNYKGYYFEFADTIYGLIDVGNVPGKRSLLN